MEIEIRVALLHVPRFPTDYVICGPSVDRRRLLLGCSFCDRQAGEWKARMGRMTGEFGPQRQWS